MGKTYTKVHTSDKAAKDHEKKIKARGGKVSKTKTKKNLVLHYEFND